MLTSFGWQLPPDLGMRDGGQPTRGEFCLPDHRYVSAVAQLCTADVGLLEGALFDIEAHASGHAQGTVYIEAPH